MKKSISFSIILISIYFKLYSQDTSARITEAGLVFSNLNSFGFRFKCGNENSLFRITALVLNSSASINDYDYYSHNGNYEDTVPQSKTSSFGLGFNIGVEQRKHINNRFYFHYGFDWINSYSYNKSSSTSPSYNSFYYYDPYQNRIWLSVITNNKTTNSSRIISTGLGIVIGVGYKLNSSFNLAAELIPNITYKNSKTTSSSNSYDVNWTGNDIYGYIPYIHNNHTEQATTNNSVNFSFSNSGVSLTLSYVL